jgi:thioesterase superfamily protein
VQLPGRANRLHEPLIFTMNDLTDILLPHLSSQRHKPYVLFGHSNGALVGSRRDQRFRNFHQATVMSGRCAGGDEVVAMTAYLGNKYGTSELSERLGDRCALPKVLYERTAIITPPASAHPLRLQRP